MATIRLPTDFKEFLKLLNSNKVRYLLVGGYAVGYYGYPRSTGDLDLWIAIQPENVDRVVITLKEFGFDLPELSSELFLEKGRIIRMGVPPLRIELLTSISGVEFSDCFTDRNQVVIDDVEINIISFDYLKKNKRAAARHKDLDDLENLPEQGII